jgi:hypothetical protein
MTFDHLNFDAQDCIAKTSIKFKEALATILTKKIICFGNW